MIDSAEGASPDCVLSQKVRVTQRAVIRPTADEPLTQDTSAENDLAWGDRRAQMRLRRALVEFF